MRRILILIALVAGFLPATSAVAQAPAQPPDRVGVRLLDAPVNRQDDPRAQTSIVDHLPVLSRIEREIEVVNTTSSTQSIQVYAAGADATDGGWTVFNDRDQNELSQYVNVSPEILEIPSNDSRPPDVVSSFM